MHKRLILACSAGTLIVVAIAAVIFGIAMGSVASVCSPSAFVLVARCRPLLSLGLAAAVVAPCLLLALALGGIAWVLGLVRTIQLKQWGWFVLILFLTPIATLMYGFYGFFGPEQRHS
jgi:hypothetical protein